MAHHEQRTLSAGVRADCAAGAGYIMPGVCPQCGKQAGIGDLRFRITERVEGLMDEDSFLRVSDVIVHCKNCAA